MEKSTPFIFSFPFVLIRVWLIIVLLCLAFCACPVISAPLGGSYCVDMRAPPERAEDERERECLVDSFCIHITMLSCDMSMTLEPRLFFFFLMFLFKQGYDNLFQRDSDLF